MELCGKSSFQIVFIFLILALEAWLGKTRKVQAGSILGVIFGVILLVITVILKKRGNDGKSV